METKTRNPIGNSAPVQTATPPIQEIKDQARDTAGFAREKLTEGAGYAREHPSETAIAGIGLGFVLAYLPLRLLIGSALRLALIVAKPAALIYGAIKLREAFRTGK